MEVLGQDEWDLMMELAKKDMIGVGDDPDDYGDEQVRSWASQLTTKMRQAAELCNMGIEELAAIIDEEAIQLEETGIPEREEAAARWDFAKSLIEYREQDSSMSCREYVEIRRKWIVANYGDDE